MEVEYPLTLRIGARQRDGFRNAKASYILKSLSRDAIGSYKLKVDGAEEMDIRVRKRDVLATRMNIPAVVMEQEVQALIQETGYYITPGRINVVEMDKHRGRMDIQSMIATKLGMDTDSAIYTSLLMNTGFSSSNPVIKYTSPMNVMEKPYGYLVQEDKRHMHYLTEPGDVHKVKENLRIDIKSRHGAIRMYASATNRGFQIDMSGYIDPTSDHFPGILSILEEIEGVTYGDDEHIVPFVLENRGLNLGSFVLHLFPGRSGEALVNWMDWCLFYLRGMLASLLNTLLTVPDMEAFYSPKLGGQAAVNMIGSLKGTIGALSGDTHASRIPDGAMLLELMHALKNSVDDEITDKRVSRVFTTAPNLRDFISKLVLFIKTFGTFESLAKYKDATFKDQLAVSRLLGRLLKSPTPIEQLFREHERAAELILDTIKTSAGDVFATTISEQLLLGLRNVKTYTA
jgi:hypothetical protein